MKPSYSNFVEIFRQKNKNKNTLVKKNNVPQRYTFFGLTFPFVFPTCQMISFFHHKTTCSADKNLPIHGNCRHLKVGMRLLYNKRVKNI
jgi:hypothetical protein